MQKDANWTPPPLPSLTFPSLPFPSLPFPSLPFPSLPFPSLPGGEGGGGGEGQENVKILQNNTNKYKMQKSGPSSWKSHTKCKEVQRSNQNTSIFMPFCPMPLQKTENRKVTYYAFWTDPIPIRCIKRLKETPLLMCFGPMLLQ